MQLLRITLFYYHYIEYTIYYTVQPMGRITNRKKIIPQEDHGSPTQNVSQHDNQIDEQIL